MLFKDKANYTAFKGERLRLGGTSLELGDPAHALGTSFYAITIARAIGDPRLEALIDRAVSHPSAGRYPVSSLVLAEAAQAARLHCDEQAEAMLRTAIAGARKARFSATGLLKPDVLRPMLATLVEMAEDGRLAPVIGRVYPLDDLPEAHRHVETGHKRGNVVVV